MKSPSSTIATTITIAVTLAFAAFALGVAGVGH